VEITMIYWLSRRRSDGVRGPSRATLRIWGNVRYEDEPILQVLGREVQMLTSLRIDLGGVREFGHELRTWLLDLGRSFQVVGNHLTLTRVPIALTRELRPGGSA
jgi:hypothetical protein